MKRQLKIDIQCGDKTCAWKEGKFCQWFTTRRLGMVAHCYLFNKDLELPEDGWTRRCEECLKYENRNEAI